MSYGAANAARTRGGSGGRDSAVVARTNVGVRTHTVSRSSGERASRIRAGAAASAGWCTPVFVSTMPRSWARCASAQPSEIGPPQSCATVTTGPSMPSASVRSPRSATRWASVRALGQPLGVAHAQLVRRDHPPARRRARDQAAPEVGPGRVAVDAQQRAEHRLGRRCRGRATRAARLGRRRSRPAATTAGRGRAGRSVAGGPGRSSGSSRRADPRRVVPVRGAYALDRHHGPPKRGHWRNVIIAERSPGELDARDVEAGADEQDTDELTPIFEVSGRPSARTCRACANLR